MRNTLDELVSGPEQMTFVSIYENSPDEGPAKEQLYEESKLDLV